VRVPGKSIKVPAAFHIF